jgi:sensor histidine kinase YesM
MKKFFKNWKGLVALLVFSYLLALYNAFHGSTWESVVFKPDAPFWIFLQGLLLIGLINWSKKKLQFSVKDSTMIARYLILFFTGLVLFLAVLNVIGLILALTYGGFERNFQPVQVLYSLLNNFLTYSIVGSVYISYLFLKEFYALQEEVIKLERVTVQNQFRELKKQLDPHFLFNNLNVLSQLVYEDPERSDRFINTLAGLYRYTLQHHDGNFSKLEDEIKLAKDYLFLVNERFDHMYELEIEKNAGTEGKYIPCFALQNLVENAVKHNKKKGNDKVKISLSITDDSLIVQNEKGIQPNNLSNGEGVGLKNLSEQYRLIGGRPIEVNEDERTFEVIIPLLKDTAHVESSDHRR